MFEKIVLPKISRGYMPHGPLFVSLSLCRVKIQSWWRSGVSNIQPTKSFNLAPQSNFEKNWNLAIFFGVRKVALKKSVLPVFAIV